MTIRHLHMGCGESLLSPLFKSFVQANEKKITEQHNKQKLRKQKKSKG